MPEYAETLDELLSMHQQLARPKIADCSCGSLGICRQRILLQRLAPVPADTPPEDVAALIKLAREHIESECDDADLIGRLAAALAARTLPEGDDVVLSVRPNPPTPSDAELLVIYESACALPIPGLAAVWRHGCDAGMVAP